MFEIRILQFFFNFCEISRIYDLNINLVLLDSIIEIVNSFDTFLKNDTTYVSANKKIVDVDD